MDASLRALLEESFANAAARGFPPFLGSVQSSTPFNSTPYVAHLRAVAEGRIMSNRAALLRELVVAVDELAVLGLEAVAALLGGSVLGSKPDPADLDCILFYRQREGVAAGAGEGLAAFQRRMKQRRLDLRLIPADGDPLILIKAVSFFTTLFAQSKNESPIGRGLVLLDCRPRH
jgi:hypothetical protein